MLCTKCNNDNPDDALFCEGCGAKLELACPTCKTLASPGGRFCKKCGTALAATRRDSHPASPSESPIRVTADVGSAAEAVDGERKTVTALFIKGSTELMEDLDPEDARAIIDPALKLMIDAVQHYDGYIVQSTGDGIFALFGAPAAHEDHPQRALHAALRMQNELRRYSAMLVADGGIPIQCRVGANTGEVVVRSISTGHGHTEYTPIGHTANLASRMQAVAPVGSIAASDVTRKLCEGYFTFKALGPAKVKGLAEPVAVHEVTGIGPLRTRLQRSVGRGLTKFVGREHEMETLKRALEQARNGHGQIVAAMADAGVGKSRLFFEFKAVARAGCMVLETFSVSHGKASAYLPVIDLLRNYFDISAGDDERKRRKKVAGKITILDRSLEDTLPYLFALLGIVEGDDPLAQMDGQVKKRRTLEAIKRILLRESLNQPLMVIFEDLHWIDEQTQDLLNLLADSIGTAKFLLSVNYRPEYSHQWNSKTYYTQLRLDPLGKESADKMLTALLGDGKNLIPLKQLIIKRTEGTPFFMEEIVQALFEDGVLQRNGVLKLVRSMNAVKVPATVQGVLASRIDRLAAEKKELLQTLAVLGREFSLGLVKHVTLWPDDELERGLARLQAGEFIYEQVAAGDVEYVFKHALTQEVAYNTLLIERRKLLHERAGQALESMFADQLDDHLDELARHYSRSDNNTKAVEYLGRAGQQAIQRAANADAISPLSAAIDLLQKLSDSPERVQRELVLQLALGPALLAVKGWGAPEAERAYTRARELCERAGDPPELFPVLFGLWNVYLLRAEARAAHELAGELLRWARRRQDPALLLYGHLALGGILFWMGELLLALEHVERAISLYEAEHHRALTSSYSGIDAAVWCRYFASQTLWELGYPDQALTRGNEAITMAQGLSHSTSLVFAQFIFCIVCQFRREARAAQEVAESVIALAAEHGLADFLAVATSVRGWAMTAQGDEEEGIAQIQGGLAGYRATGSAAGRLYVLCLLAEACRAPGRHDEGLRAVSEALAAAGDSEYRNYEAETYRLKGELLLRQDQSDICSSQTRLLGSPSFRLARSAAEAQECFERAIEIARKQSAKSWELRAKTSLARLLASQGHRDQARSMLAEIYNWFTEGFDTADLKDAKALLNELAE